MMLSEEDEEGDGSDGNKEDSDEEDCIAFDSDEEEDTAAEILESVRIGTGAHNMYFSVEFKRRCRRC